MFVCVVRAIIKRVTHIVPSVLGGEIQAIAKGRTAMSNSDSMTVAGVWRDLANLSVPSVIMSFCCSSLFDFYMQSVLCSM